MSRCATRASGKSGGAAGNKNIGIGGYRSFCRQGACDVAACAGSEGPLVFALDATMSRQPTWDNGLHAASDMFREAAEIGKPRYPAGLLSRPQRVPCQHWISDTAHLPS